MKLQFDANQNFQLDAVAAVTDLFDGQPQGAPEYTVIDLGNWDDDGLVTGQSRSELGVGNNLLLAPDKLKDADKPKKGQQQPVWKDTRSDTQADDEVYNPIMKDKERLLSEEESLRFIFSHSALREGWDNDQQSIVSWRRLSFPRASCHFSSATSVAVRMHSR